MKNLNTLVEEFEKELYDRYPEGFEHDAGRCYKRCDIDVIGLTEQTIKKAVQTALTECRPVIRDNDDEDYAETYVAYGYNQCLSDYDEKVKSFLE